MNFDKYNREPYELGKRDSTLYIIDSYLYGIHDNNDQYESMSTRRDFEKKYFDRISSPVNRREE